MGEADSVGVLEKKYSRRTFIKGVIATGATVSSAGYLFRGTSLLGAPVQTVTERMITLNVNGQQRVVDVLPHETLAMTLRYKLNLTGTKLGCDRAECGACTVHLDGKPVRSCSTPISAAEGKTITTIEGIKGQDGTLHKVQQAWIAEQVPQCGYCQSGQIMAATALLEKNPRPTDAQIDNAMAGNVCRCGMYGRIRKAIKAAAGIEQPSKVEA